MWRKNKRIAPFIFIVDLIRNACIMVIKMNNKPREVTTMKAYSANFYGNGRSSIFSFEGWGLVPIGLCGEERWNGEYPHRIAVVDSERI
jgi:hypothetical protein